MATCRMKFSDHIHQAVLSKEALEALNIKPSGIYVDTTFGRGGHARAILALLNFDGRLIAFDKDPEAIAYAHQYFAHDKRFQIFQGSFNNLKDFLSKENLFGKIDGILFDLGVSSPQLDNPARGFSFSKNGPLDMRMDPTSGLDASTWINKVSERTLAQVLYEFGEERLSRQIARAIVKARLITPITQTEQLAHIICKATPFYPKGKHPATRTFQAIRIFINHELDDLKAGLAQALNALCICGRLAVISFHSLEDRIVKQFIQHHERGDKFPAKLPIKYIHLKPTLRKVEGPIKPSLQEISQNPRARSATLRVGEKLS